MNNAIKFLCAIGLVSLANVATETDAMAAQTVSGAAGSAPWPADAACFQANFGAAENAGCATTKEWSVYVPYSNTGYGVTVTNAPFKTSECRLLAYSRDPSAPGGASMWTAYTAISNTTGSYKTDPVLWSVGSLGWTSTSSAWHFEVNCRVAPGSMVRAAWAN